jgi:hypothetical protein
MVLASLALLAAPVMAGEFMDKMPPAGEYTIHSLPSFNIAVGDRTEVLECDAELILRTSEPYVTETGHKRQDVQILDWVAKGKSELLGDVTFKMIEGKAADESYVESFQVWDADNPRDFPARAQFAVMYELTTQFGTVSGLYGFTEGSTRAFPPRGDIFTMVKGDTADLMAELMPEPVSSLSATGEVTPVSVSVRPAACFCPEPQ